MTTPELLPCPFCGDNRASTYHVRDGRVSRCPACGAESGSQFNGPLDLPSADDRAIAAWNRRTPSPEVAALIAEARREDAKLLLDAYKGGVLVLMRMLDKAGLVAGASAADQISKRIVDAHPEFPGMASLRALKETTHD